ncbi:hypothetical protein K2Z83_21025 [Oscillochloris sp. ZM17-4]|uniref:hypothetical protein n=1 Tax=Oscillochloris sp. ZM17-4 TaxID=2866714 RepID=UPI001C73DBB6|nr:hypothetical protein [Oscillochloris sp. ZM17-4]MBX0330155.1 hypothetical protein [Oscillochloris sp. ZM17-4]
MSILGSIIALGAALAFAAIAVLAVWGGLEAVRREILRGFVSANPGPADRALTLLLVGVPLAGVAAIGLLSAVRVALVALGLG